MSLNQTVYDFTATCPTGTAIGGGLLTSYIDDRMSLCQSFRKDETTWQVTVISGGNNPQTAAVQMLCLHDS